MVKRKCKYCEATTTQPLSDFCEIGWEAVSFSGRLAVCACPEHTKKLEGDIRRLLVSIFSVQYSFGRGTEVKK